MKRLLLPIIIVLLLLPTLAGAAPALLQHAGWMDQTSQPSDQQTLTFSEGSLVVVAVGLSASNISITVGSPGLSFQEDILEFDYDIRVAIWSAPNVSAGSHTITVSVSSGAYIRWSVSEWSGMATSSHVIDSSSASDYTDTIISGTVTIGASDINTLLYAATRTDGDETTHGLFYVGSGYTFAKNCNDQDPSEPHQKLCVEYKVVSGAGAYANGYTMDGVDDWVVGLVAYKAAVASGTCGTAGLTGASPYIANSASLANVEACVENVLVVAGDTINVPAGEATWGSTITVTKGLNIIGAGNDPTEYIRAGQPGYVAKPCDENSYTCLNGNANPFIQYSNSNLTNNETFRLSGFDFDMGGSGYAVLLGGEGDGFVPQTNIRIDNNTFRDSDTTGGGIIQFNHWGVVDNNKFYHMGSPLRNNGDDWSPQSANEETYAGAGIALGSQLGMYYEDNEFTGTGRGGYGMLSDSDHTYGRYVVRYNWIHSFHSYGGNYIDLHPENFGYEIYGNLIEPGSIDDNITAWRSGKAFSAFNLITATGWSDYGYDNIGCGVYPDPSVEFHDGYFFANREVDGANQNLIPFSEGSDNCGLLVQNSTYWLNRSACIYPNTCSNIPQGVGCGAFSDLPATCTTGTVYWATASDEEAMCSDLTNYTGDLPSHPQRKEIDGALYKCVSTDTWEPYVSLLEYPHPLRSEVLSPAAVLTGSLSGNGTEAEIVVGGEDIIITLSNDTWVAEGATFDAQRQNIIDGIDSSPGNVELNVAMVVSEVVRCAEPCNNIATITLLPQTGYDISVNESITITIPASALVSNTDVVAAPSFSIAAAGAGPSTKYWIAPDADPATTWAACNSDTDISAYCHMNVANASLVAGDTAYVTEGTYNGNNPDENIDPVNSGEHNNPITYQGIGEVTITGGACNGAGEPAIDLRGAGSSPPGNNYVYVKDINASNCRYFIMVRNGGSYNAISDGVFNRNTLLQQWNASIIDGDAEYNWIHHNTFSKAGECRDGTPPNGVDDGSALDVGAEGDDTDNTRYNLVEDNIFFHAGHHLLGLFGNRNTVRNNYFHNEAWDDGAGNRTMYIAGFAAVSNRNLIENNRFGYAARPCDDTETGGVALTTSYNIFRYNSLYHHNVYGLSIAPYYPESDVNYNKIYNNTFFNNCDQQENPSICTGGGYDDSAVAFNDWTANEVKYNVFRNNLYFSHDAKYTDTDQADMNDQFYYNEFEGEVDGDPLFVNADPSWPADKTDETVPDLNLEPTSPAIDQGGSLTTVSSVTDSNTIVLADAGYFQDGTWGPPGKIDADFICIGTITNCVQISSINYSTNSVDTIFDHGASPSDEVWLFKDSDGTVVLKGLAPDAGAYESDLFPSTTGVGEATFQ